MLHTSGILEQAETHWKEIAGEFQSTLAAYWPNLKTRCCLLSLSIAVSRICHPKVWLQKFKTCHFLENAVLLYWLFWAIGTWKTANAGQGILWTRLISLDRFSKKNSNVINRFLISQGRLTLITAETRSRHHTQTHFVTSYHASHLFF